MQIARFQRGAGYVLHAITLAGYCGKFSAWFDVAGELLNVEHLRPHARSVWASHNVKRNGSAWQSIASIGARFADATADAHGTRPV